MPTRLALSAYLRDSLLTIVRRDRQNTHTHTRSAFRCAGTSSQQTPSVERLACTQTAKITDTVTIGSPTGHRLALHAIAEHSPTHPKTFAFFEHANHIIFPIDLATLHEIHPTAHTTNAAWTTQRLAGTLHFRNPRRMIFLAFISLEPFEEAMAGGRTADDYLAGLFEDYTPPAEDDDARSGSSRAAHRQVLDYLVQRLGWLGDGGPHFVHILAGDSLRYFMLYDSIIETVVARYMVCGGF